MKLRNAIFVFLIAASGVFLPAQGMHNKILLGCKFVGAGLAVYPFWNSSYKASNPPYRFHLQMPPNTHKLTQDIVNEYNLIDKDSMQFGVSNGPDWHVMDDGAIEIGARLVEELEGSLKIIKDAESGIFVDNEELINAQLVVAWHIFCIRHECGHKYLEHMKGDREAYFLVPCIVQAAWSCSTCLVAHIFSIKPPTNMLFTALRSSLAIGCSLPKFLLSCGLLASGCIFPTRFMQEQDADKFARADAHPRELEAMRNVDLAVSQGSLLFPIYSTISEALAIGGNLSKHDRERIYADQENLDRSYRKYRPDHPGPAARAEALEKDLNNLGSEPKN